MGNAYKKAFDKVKMPSQLEKEILNMTINSKKKIKKKFFTRLITACIILCLLASGLVYASTTEIWIGIFGTNDEGINTAVEYDYVQNVNMDYVVSNGVGVKFESVMLDNSTFDFVIDYQVGEAIPICDWINTDITIADENGIVLYGEGKGMLATGGETHIPTTNDNLTFKMAHIAENVNHTYPQSKKIYVEITNIKFFEDAPKIAKEFTGNWKFEIDMSDKFADRTSLNYVGGDITGSEIIAVNYAELTSVSLDVELKLSEPFEITKRLKLVDANGMEYESKQIAPDDGNVPYLVRTSFPITVFKTTDKLTLYYGEDSVELIKE
jgi:hypothetical protein